MYAKCRLHNNFIALAYLKIGIFKTDVASCLVKCTCSLVNVRNRKKMCVQLNKSWEYNSKHPLITSK